jgi:hypothetical protein
MKSTFVLSLLLAGLGVVQAQERPAPPEGSTRLAITGCVKGRSLIVARREGAETVASNIAPGRRFRLAGPKKIVSEIRAKDGQLVEVTGLVRTAQLSPATQGVPVGKSGRVRIGGGPINADPTRINPARAPSVNEPVMDVESWRPFPERCPARDE